MNPTIDAPPVPACPEATQAAVARISAALDAAFGACLDPADPSRCAAFARAVRAALNAALAEPLLVGPGQREGRMDRYQRHPIYADPRGRYALATLVWQPGQASPVHAHHTWCGYVVLEGELTETLYAWDEARGASSVRIWERAIGAISFAGRGRGGIHRLSNDSERTVVSLHVYGVSGEQIATHVNDVVSLAGTEPHRR